MDPKTETQLTNQQRADLALAKGFCPIPLRRAGKLPAVKISAAQHGAAAWNQEHAARYDFNRAGITVGIFLLGDALVFDVDAKVTDEEGGARFDAMLLRRITDQLPAELCAGSSMSEPTKHGRHYWFADSSHFHCAIGAVVDDEGAKLGVDILKRHKNQTGRIVKIHDDGFWTNIPAVSDLNEVPEAVMQWYDQCRSDRWHQRKATQRKNAGVHEPQGKVVSTAVADFEKALWQLDFARCYGYDDWWKVKSYGQSLGPDALPIFNAWSSQVKEKYSETTTEEWAVQIGTPEISRAAFIKMCREDAPDVWERLYNSKSDWHAHVEACFGGQSDHAIAKLAYAMLGERIIAVAGTGKSIVFYHFNGTIWQKDPSGSMLSHALSTSVLTEVTKWFRIRLSALEKEKMDEDEARKEVCELTGSFAKVLRCLEMACAKSGIMREYAVLSLHDHPAFLEQLDTDCNLIAFTNGVYDMARATFRQARPNDFLSISTGYAYEKAKAADVAELLEKFIDRVFVNPALREYWLMTVASMCDGKARRQKFNIWTRGGSNGKSMCALLLSTTFGEYCGKLCASFIQSQRSCAGNAKPEIMALRGRRFALMEEPEPDRGLNEGLIKEYSGSDEITGRQLYEAQITFVPQFSMVMCCNELPETTDSSLGWRRRIDIVPFNSVFGFDRNDQPLKKGDERPDKGIFQADLSISDRFEQWRHAFFEIVMARYSAYLADPGFTDAEVERVTQEYLDSNDSFAQFVADDLMEVEQSDLEQYNARRHDPNARKKSVGDFVLLMSEVDSLYNMWLKRHGRKKTANARQIKKKIHSKFHPVRSRAGMAVRGWARKYDMHTQGAVVEDTAQDTGARSESEADAAESQLSAERSGGAEV